MNNNIKLFNNCNWNNSNKVSDILISDKKLDVIQSDGNCIIFAVQHENADMMEALLKYFYEVQLPQIDNKYLRKDSENKLKEILEEVESSWVITEEIEQVINKYLDSEGSTADSSDKNIGSPKKHNVFAKTVYNNDNNNEKEYKSAQSMFDDIFLDDKNQLISISDPIDNIDPIGYFNASAQDSELSGDIGSNATTSEG